MFPVFSYYNNHRTWTCFVFFFLLSLPLFPAMFLPDSISELNADGLTNSSWHGFMRFLDAGKGSRFDGMAELKRYFGRFGYLPVSSGDHNFTDFFDEEFESALVSYQKNLGLSETGRLNYDTMRVIISPRCGVSDVSPSAGGRFKTTRHFAYFYGKPRWARPSPMTLTYAFSPAHMIDYVNSTDVKSAFRSAFSRWSAVIPVNFTEARRYSSADIKIGWYSGDHGDGEAFDGVLGVLAHAFSPENGRFHLDAAERWAVDFTAEKSKVAVDLESVATHEIGHVLGLAHSTVKEAIMYPSLSPRKKKAELREDDVAGIQALYGSNPNYRYDSKLESDISSSWGIGSDIKKRILKRSGVIVGVASLLSLGL
ncbi:metalloendoproteinase 1-MMP [Primulina tabacum]|uniref:metalloendoproteinase 1-MMP n=1 Tax=Primulina tabacum TaxID=48773 RepID=UPI003F5A4EA1